MASKEETPKVSSSTVPSLENTSQNVSSKAPINAEDGSENTGVSNDVTESVQEKATVDNATGESIPAESNVSEAPDPSIGDDIEDMDVDEAKQTSRHGNNEGIGGDYRSPTGDTPDSDSSNDSSKKLWLAVACSEDQREKEEVKSKSKDKKGKNKSRNPTGGGGGVAKWKWGNKHKPKIRLPKEPSYWSSRDTVAYRKGYPSKRDNPLLCKNYEFYTNKIPSVPNGNFIDIIHEEWWGHYDHLEWHHGYIQWLFPIREPGLNWHSQELQLHEVKKICEDSEAHERIVKSYEMMLDFYGMKLADRKDGTIQRADNWKDRFDHLNHSMHNYLRITRILKCLGEFKYERYKVPFVKFVLHEAINERTLTGTLESCMNYWVEVIKNDEERKKIRAYAKDLADASNAQSDHKSDRT